VKGLTKLLFLIVLSITFSLLFAPTLARADIKVIPPANWQPAPYNNSTSMAWFQNYTKSFFGIIKPNLPLSLPLLFVGPGMAQFFANMGALESVDQMAFGRSNFGYRYFLNFPSYLSLVNTTSWTPPETYFYPLFQNDNVPLKMMVILTQKQDDFYGIIFLSPRDNFDSKLNELKPTLDSIQLGNSTATNQVQ
jgi:hypothetical protein